MTVRKMLSLVVAVGSAWLGGSLGAAALEQANAAPLAGPTSVATAASSASSASQASQGTPRPAASVSSARSGQLPRL